MPTVGPLELAIVLIVALVIFGPKRLPELGRSLGGGMREFKNSVTGKDTDADPSRAEQGVGDAARRRGSASPASTSPLTTISDDPRL